MNLWPFFISMPVTLEVPGNSLSLQVPGHTHALMLVCVWISQRGKMCLCDGSPSPCLYVCWLSGCLQLEQVSSLCRTPHDPLQDSMVGVQSQGFPPGREGSSACAAQSPPWGCSLLSCPSLSPATFPSARRLLHFFCTNALGLPPPKSFFT